MYRRFLFGSRGNFAPQGALFFKIFLKEICEKQMDLLLSPPRWDHPADSPKRDHRP